jgi:hypothetical protein
MLAGRFGSPELMAVGGRGGGGEREEAMGSPFWWSPGSRRQWRSRSLALKGGGGSCSMHGSFEA